jgi:hypothetical protein
MQDRISGVAELAFASVGDFDHYREQSRLMMLDEPNVFRRSIRYVTYESGGSRSVIDARYLGPFGKRRLMILLRKRGDVAQADFRRRAYQEFLSALSRDEEVEGLSWHWFEERANRPNPGLSRNVDHDAPADRQYSLMLNLEFIDATAMRRFFHGPLFAQTETAQRALFARVHGYSVVESCVFVREGAMTTAGLRGGSVADLIRETGAANQTTPEVRRLIATSGKDTSA